MLKSSQIAAIINEVYDGVERSKCGPIIHRKDEKGDPVYHNLSWQTYIHVLEAILPKTVSMNVDMEEK